ncbi:MAG: 16S rRNA (guanine(966)-N(2))-methyltransferase RsmD [candidate division KSB1 bacterium]|nr:16S rRNA (guanine(966)-N(2))-methyltransferase RsmD [candidate division KSB1 bacterium]MDZ7318106.1 16S rRNA (guanine(966)-N(2))-methyltransferase RsmD [candidate division KSB1 bacterium]
MRIIAGSAKGRRLISPRHPQIRPTSDRVKQALFDYINPWVGNASVLDLFSGSGNLGLEALSRGAKLVVLVDNSSDSIRLITKNATSLGWLSQCQIVRQDVFRYLKLAARIGQQFDLIFADPPYAFEDYAMLIESISSGNILSARGLFILEHRSRHKIDSPQALLTLETTRIFGDTAISVFKLKGSDFAHRYLSGDVRSTD